MKKIIADAEPFHPEPGAYVRVRVIDDGSGMDEATLARSRDPFFTTKRGHRGLGLAWAYGIITNHSGSATRT